MAALCEAFGKPGASVRVWLLLQAPFVFQMSRHRRLARRLDLPEAAVGSGFDYIARGEMPAGVDAQRLVHVRRGP